MSTTTTTTRRLFGVFCDVIYVKIEYVVCFIISFLLPLILVSQGLIKNLNFPGRWEKKIVATAWDCNFLVFVFVGTTHMQAVFLAGFLGYFTGEFVSFFGLDSGLDNCQIFVSARWSK